MDSLLMKRVRASPRAHFAAGSPGKPLAHSFGSVARLPSRFRNARSRAPRGHTSPLATCSAAEATPGSLARFAGARGDERAVVSAVPVRSAATGEEVTLGVVLPEKGRVIVPFFTQFGDFDSFELAKRLVDELPELEKAGVEVVAVGIGSVEAAQDFAAKTRSDLKTEAEPISPPLHYLTYTYQLPTLHKPLLSSSS